MDGMDGMDGMSGMDGMNGTNSTDGGCKVSMLWNWYTIDACFLSDSWQIQSQGGFAALLIGVVLLVVLLEFLRRVAKTYDRYLVNQYLNKVAASSPPAAQSSEKAEAPEAGQSTNALLAPAFRQSRNLSNASGQAIAEQHQLIMLAVPGVNGGVPPTIGQVVVQAAPFRPNLVQQAIRALLHTLQFALGYWIMLLAMYYNGYVIIMIIIGAFIGSFIFQWEQLGPR
ncbi:Ctr copper transporter [Xylariaceae sp. AK1471]|nr:Ctr copper transporter [Xylariaceae sp. AK1471]